MQRIAVTGASGFIGKVLVAQLNPDYDIITCSRSGESTVRGDITDDNVVRKLFSHNPDTLIHLAGLAEGTGPELFRVNVLGTATLLAQLPPSVKKVIFLSSFAVYGSSNKPFKESDKLSPNTDYGFSKKLAEEVATYYAKQAGVQLIILRSCSVYGPGNDKGVIHAFAQQLQHGQVKITGAGTQRRSFIHVQDLVQAITAIAKHEKEGVFNVSTPENVTIKRLAQLMCTGRDVKMEFIEQDTSKPKNMVSSPLKLINRGYWKPQILLSEGLKTVLPA